MEICFGVYIPYMQEQVRLIGGTKPCSPKSMFRHTSLQYPLGTNDFTTYRPIVVIERNLRVKDRNNKS